MLMIWIIGGNPSGWWEDAVGCVKVVKEDSDVVRTIHCEKMFGSQQIQVEIVERESENEGGFEFICYCFILLLSRYDFAKTCAFSKYEKHGKTANNDIVFVCYTVEKCITSVNEITICPSEGNECCTNIAKRRWALWCGREEALVVRLYYVVGCLDPKLVLVHHEHISIPNEWQVIGSNFDFLDFLWSNLCIKMRNVSMKESWFWRIGMWSVMIALHMLVEQCIWIELLVVTCILLFHCGVNLLMVIWIASSLRSWWQCLMLLECCVIVWWDLLVVFQIRVWYWCHCQTMTMYSMCMLDEILPIWSVQPVVYLGWWLTLIIVVSLCHHAMM